MKNSLTFNILSKQGLPNGANEVRQNMFGAVVSLDDFINIPNYKEGGDNGEDELITYKNNKSKVDGTANWNWSSDVDVSSAYNDQIKARLLTGNYGYNPKTGELVKLGKSEQTKVTDKEVAQTLNTLKGKDQKRNVSVAIPKEDSYNPNFIVKDSRGNDMDVSQFQGQSVNMTPAEATAYRKAQVGKNAPIAQAKMNNAFRAAASVTPVGMAINAIDGATRLGMDVPELIKDPSLSTAGAVGMDLLMASPFIPAAASKTGQVISKVDDALMNAPRAQMTLNSGVNPSMMINAYQDARAAIDKVKGIKFPFSKTGQQLDQIKGSGAYWDEVGIPGKDLVSKTDMVEYVGTKSGRPVVNVKMPDGTTQSFYKSSGWAGKAGDGVGGTTEGMWQPFGGFTKHPKVKSGDWFIKDAGYKDFYGSQTYKDMANSMDDVLIKKLGAKNVDELDDMINFQSRNRPGDDFIPDYNHGGSHFLENNTGLEATQLEDKPIDKDAMTAMMKSKFATALAFGNPAAKRMVNAPGKDANLDDYIYTGDEYDANWGVDVGQEPGTKGSHYMAGFGNKAVPFIQERNGKLDFISDPHVINPETRELARDESGNIISNTDEFFYFDNPKDAKYFSEHYKEIAPDSSYRDDGGTVLNLTDEMIHEYKTGGYTVEYLD